MLSRTARLTVVTAVAMGLFLGTAAFTAISLSSPPETLLATTLHVGVIQGPDVPLGWQASTTINEPQSVTFRWSTTDQNVGSARWRVTIPGSGGPQQVATGVIQHIPTTSGQTSQFTIDFNGFAPKPAPNTPIVYDVTVSTYPPVRAGGRMPSAISTSSPVKVTYRKSTQPGVTFDPDFGYDARTIRISLNRLDAKKDDDALSSDEPYIIMVRFRFRTTISAAGMATPLPGTLQTSVVGPGGHNNLGRSSDNWCKQGTNYDITAANLRINESVPTGQPGWVVGAVIAFFEEDAFTASTVTQIRNLIRNQVNTSISTMNFNVNSNEISDAVVRSIKGKIGDSFKQLNFGLGDFLSGIAQAADPDDFGGVNVVMAATVPGGRVMMFAGSPPTTASAVVSGATQVTGISNFALNFPSGDLSKVPWNARYTGSCIVRGTVTIGLQ